MFCSQNTTLCQMWRLKQYILGLIHSICISELTLIAWIIISHLYFFKEVYNLHIWGKEKAKIFLLKSSLQNMHCLLRWFFFSYFFEFFGRCKTALKLHIATYCIKVCRCHACWAHESFLLSSILSAIISMIW